MLVSAPKRGGGRLIVPVPPRPEHVMNTLLLSLMVTCALVTVGCERKAPDNMNPKTSAGSSGSQSTPSGTNDSRSSTPAGK
jgi:hypothetical protein